jgi:hypothetical protein
MTDHFGINTGQHSRRFGLESNRKDSRYAKERKESFAGRKESSGE